MWYKFILRLATGLLFPRLTDQVDYEVDFLPENIPAGMAKQEPSRVTKLELPGEPEQEPAKVDNSLPVGRNTKTDRFRLPIRLIGRDEESRILRIAFERACRGDAAAVWVGGYAGTGKTTLIKETIRALVFTRGYFITGKCDQLQTNIPYAPLLQAFGDLILQFLTESPESLDRWKTGLNRVLGGNAPVITALIPELEFLIGKQAPAEQLSPKEAQNRLYMVFCNLIRALGGRKHPLVIFLDDLQWADPASCQLIGQLAGDPNLGGLLLVLAGRENEITEGHPFRTASSVLENGGMRAERITLTSFNQTETCQFVAETLDCSEEAPNLAGILYRKTGGNPLFLSRMLFSLQDDGLLIQAPGDGRWRWDPACLDGIMVPEDVVGFMLVQLAALPDNSLTVLKLAACIGNIFDLPGLSQICDMDIREVFSALNIPLAQGLIFSDEDALAFEFLHDRVRQVAYSLVPEEIKQRVHLRLGNLLLAGTNIDELDAKICTVADHFNRGRDLIENRAGKVEAARLNLLAGRKAKASAAFESARDYFIAGQELMPADSWDDQYRLTYDLYWERCQCEYLCSDFEAAGELFRVLQLRAGSSREKAELFGMQAVLCTSLREYPQAIRMGLQALNCFGLHLSCRPGKPALLKELLLVRLRLTGMTKGSLAGLVELNDPEKRERVRLLATLAVSAFPVNSRLYAMAILKGVNLSLRYGTTDLLYPGIAAYSSIPGLLSGDWAAGRMLAVEASALSEKCNSGWARCLGHYLIGSQLSHWSEHAGVSLFYLRKAVNTALDSGEFVIAGYSLIRIMELRFCMSTTLEEIFRECRENYDLGRRIQHEPLVLYATIFDRYLSALRKESQAASPLVRDNYEESVNNVSKVSMVVHCLLQMQLHYLMGDCMAALTLADKSRPDLTILNGNLILAEHSFYHALAITGAIPNLRAGRKRHYLKVLRQARRQMKKWSEGCPANFLHKYLLLEAEIARLNGRDGPAMTLYEQSIRAAASHGYVQNGAIAAELAARLYLARGQDRVARIYLNEACDNYACWGATAKVAALRERYGALLNGTADPEEESTDLPKPDTPRVTDGLPPQGRLDDRWKALEIYGEGNPRQALSRFLALAMESSAADRGYLILEKGEKLFVEAFLNVSVCSPEGQAVFALEQGVNLPVGVVRYVARILEPVILNDVAQAGIFARDPYIACSRNRSIACWPLLFMGVPLGVLYLENTRAAGVFTSERMEFLQGFSTQIAYLGKLLSFLEDENTSGAEGEEAPPVADLTAREQEVLDLIAAGLSNKQIAARLGVGVSTVKSHILSIYGKLRVSRRVQAVNKAKKLGILKNK